MDLHIFIKIITKRGILSKFNNKQKNQRQQKDEDNKPIVVYEQEKSLIKNMLTKPWNLYIFRHSALTEKAKF